MVTQDFLFEIGCEELPSCILNKLSNSLSHNIQTQLEKAALSFETLFSFATPCRLAVLINGLATEQSPRVIQRQGPNVKAAFKKDGTPTLACLGFARSCGISTDQLHIKETKKGSFVYCYITQSGQSTKKLLPEIIQTAIKQLPILKGMRWGVHTEPFVRPVRWAVMIFGNSVIPAIIFGQITSDKTRGHHFHCPERIIISKPNDYQQILLTHGMVIADFEKRFEKTRILIQKVAAIKGQAIIDKDLLTEVTGMVEWPVALLGHFKEKFLGLPPEVLIAIIKMHQRCFPIKDKTCNLLPYFILVSNIESKNPKCIIEGNERVINARLSDALFFYNNDLDVTLESRLPKLAGIVFEHQLGTLADKTKRISRLATFIAKQIHIDELVVQRGSLLSKCDLVSKMVYEFPSLQGIMGYHYSLHDRESESLANAIREHYQPRFSGDALPQSLPGACIALADRLDTIIGIIGIYKLPKGDKDPFALRRAAIGVLRILIEKRLPLDLLKLLEEAKKNVAIELPNKKVVDQSFEFIIERLRTWYLEKNVPLPVFIAVLSAQPTQPLDFDRRIKAVQHFQTLPEADALSAANKRVSNILKKQPSEEKLKLIDDSLFDSDAERMLAKALKVRAKSVNNLYRQANYSKALNELASLREPIDAFFNEVIVMTNDEKKRNNRFALLLLLRKLFTQIADISLLS
ncbi:glycine--tRNA ligase subunit beta [Coxiella endosymbiont of Amblyomma nuttalli]|uniref:glycine--tRNA ligase subunit beta n=1 Tax=Coxiella endosymbiont of Amblyomma nuttalli TaxID=2749996 RepID=UPI001BA98942|nr:glycine--tRNA ligase subunit beta [Coxiella endosymbiont of Amblyomma nuttalli]QTS83561.1 Glycine--tRNA ligase beta subunit [Coxiella endosymbiont of Amblyomma nuttalli]